MKKIILVLSIILVVTQSTIACDFCNSYLGLNPHFKKNSLGVRYHYSSYKGSHHSDEELQTLSLMRTSAIQHDGTSTTKTGVNSNDFWETRTTIELHGQWYPTQKLQLLFSLPYINNQEGVKATSNSEAEKEKPINGFGDPLLITHYQLFNIDKKSINHRLLAGGGLKFPLGNYKLADGEEAMERVHKPGSGSWDFIASASYLAKLKRLGFNLNTSYLFTTENNQAFQFGNRFNANGALYYELKKKNISCFPSVGIYFEQAARDNNNRNTLKNSGGSILYAHVGTDIYYKKFALNIAAQLPTTQSLHEPQPNIQCRIITGITLALN